jgi:putative ABC transport system permease protein
LVGHYFKIAWRNIRKSKLFTFINAFGLAVGFASCLLIASFLYDEWNYDRSPVHSRDIYRVELNTDNRDYYSAVDVAVGAGIRSAFPEVVASTRLIRWSNIFVQREEKQFKEQAIAVVDSNFFEFFSLPFESGDVHKALTGPDQVVLSRADAIKYFGTANAIGRSLLIGTGNSLPYKVVGVLADMPANRHFNFDFYCSMPEYAKNQTWSNIGWYTYVQLLPGTDPKRLEAAFPSLVAKYVVPEVQHDMGVGFAEAQKSVETFKFYMKPLRDIHLKSSNKDELEANGSLKYVYIFAALAFFILLLAAVNFTNLSTAGSLRRSREVGVRKVLGSFRRQLIAQFLAESVFVALMALALSGVMIYFALPVFNQISGKNIRFGFFLQPKEAGLVFLSAVLIGCAAGLYPAFFLSSFMPVQVLKGSAGAGKSSRSVFRSGLIVFQFTVSIGMMIATMIVYQQLKYMQQKDLGFNKEQTLLIRDSYLLGNNEAAFRDKLKQDRRVSEVSISRDVPFDRGTDGTEAYTMDLLNQGHGPEIHLNIYHVDESYVPALGLKILSGRNFSKDYPSDSAGILLNETAVREFGFGHIDPIGKTIIRSGQRKYTVVGVLRDFNYVSVKEMIAPLSLLLGGNRGGMLVRVAAEDIPALLTDVHRDWDQFHASGPFSYAFLDDQFAGVYRAEQQTGHIFTVFAALSIVIASLGLFGLSAFSTQQRTKEIGVRKVLGASVPQVVGLLSGQFLFLVLLAFAIAVPVTFFVMHQWLREFAYRIHISLWLFLLAGLAAIMIAFATISIHAIKAALSNPVRSLRSV